MTGAVHMTRPREGASIFGDAPLWCGRRREHDTPVTVWRHRATCQRCIRADEQYAEDSEYRRTQARLERERRIANGSLVSHSVSTSASGTLCGEYNEGDLIDSSAVTCPACKARIYERAREQTPTPKREQTMSEQNITNPDDTTRTDDTSADNDTTTGEPAANQADAPVVRIADKPTEPTSPEPPAKPVPQTAAELDEQEAAELAEFIEAQKRRNASKRQALAIDDRAARLRVVLVSKDSETVTIKNEDWLRISDLALRPDPAPVVTSSAPEAASTATPASSEDKRNETIADEKNSRLKPPTNKPPEPVAKPTEKTAADDALTEQDIAALKIIGDTSKHATQEGKHKGAASCDLQEHLKLADTSARDLVNSLKDARLVKFRGTGKWRRYYLTDSGKAAIEAA